ncbi:MAG: alpha/beta hydrolase [Pedosphaera sp.]|nr:alpha/beta hydrolase [Pedosphaera sp.]
MKSVVRILFFLSGMLAVSGCGTYRRVGLSPARAKEVESESVQLRYALSAVVEEKILALDPEHVTDAEIRGVLAGAPAPRMMLIHGGLESVFKHMVSFGEFLIGMGYPGQSITNPGDGTYTFSCLESADMIAGIAAWYYEKESLRPMIVGHSQGGMQAIKVLHRLNGVYSTNLTVWNPLTWKSENRFEITDPLTGRPRSVVGLKISYASTACAGGLTRLLPNQWDVIGKLRAIPNSVEEFTGFYNGPDWKGGDNLGFGPANHSHALGTARVRNVQLPSEYEHSKIPDTRHLLQSQPMMDWINAYRPADVVFDAPTLEATFTGDSRHILWAADVWFSIKKHWVLELQNLIRARRAAQHVR